ncbi:MAG: hypothetical protein HF300_04305 [Ignavibacteria bacterium]|jgi:hypothetical protein|nr:hypothetical protein [Ignavibacteria bacterium]MCU7497957.1 hypothetical protein [Ignavibacteria bacterium]MCU7511757.1 hypothetical protein [Ignavibacteria bacterium]MCU7519831.1 hypothetical protein [Ignavibacteria bacterium]MCU7524092.1 hypothetical protein [Ignavibacteria bacterium]
MKKIILFSALVLVLANSLAAQEKPSPKLSGLMFGDYFYNIDQRDSSKKNLNGFQFRRIYVTADYTVSESFDTRFRLEADQSASSLTSGGKIGVMVKDAYLKWKNIFPGSDFYFGISPTPEIETAESFWGYRSLEKTITDLNGIVSSRDLGVDLRGKFDEAGAVKYWVKVGNNSGNAPEVNKYKRFYGMLQFIPLSFFQFTLYGDYASYAPKADALDKKSKSNNSFVGALNLNFFRKDLFSAGIETFYKTQENNFAMDKLSPLKTQNGYGVSAYAWYRILDRVRLVGRYDKYNPNTDMDKNDRTDLILGAVDFQVDKNVSIMPNLESVKYSGIKAGDLIGRVTFSYQF